jgi:hypothetical protein
MYRAGGWLVVVGAAPDQTPAWSVLFEAGLQKNERAAAALATARAVTLLGTTLCRHSDDGNQSGADFDSFDA